MDDNKVIAIEQLPYIDLNKITFKEIISTNSAYGIVWSGIYSDTTDTNTNNHQIVRKRSHDYSSIQTEINTDNNDNICISNGTIIPSACAIKMIVLKSGSYYDKDNDKYVIKTDKDDIINNCELIHKYYPFHRDNKFPFLHTKFKHKRGMTRTEFRMEISNQLMLNKYNLSPKIYAYGKTHHINSIQYGIIVMELLYGSLKDFLSIRSLTSREQTLLIKSLDKLHNRHGMIHGDLKPSNIAVRIDSKKNKEMNKEIEKEMNKNKEIEKEMNKNKKEMNKEIDIEITKFLFLDCNRIKYKDSMAEEEFNKKVRSDLRYLQSTLNLTKNPLRII